MTPLTTPAALREAVAAAQFRAILKANFELIVDHSGGSKLLLRDNFTGQYASFEFYDDDGTIENSITYLVIDVFDYHYMDDFSGIDIDNDYEVGKAVDEIGYDTWKRLESELMIMVHDGFAKMSEAS